MTPLPPRARAAHFDLLFVRPAPVAAAGARSRWGTLALVSAVTLVAAALRLWTLGAQSFSPAETAYVAHARDTAWNLHGILIRAVGAAFGPSDAVLRAPSALAGIATIPLVYAAVRRLASREIALAAAALLAVAPLHVSISQDARPFVLAPLLVAGVALAALRTLGPARLQRFAARASELPRSRRALVLAACAALVPVAAAALASATWRPAKSDWRGAVAKVESRVVAEDLLLFDGPRSERAYLRYALRADDRVTLGGAAPDGAVASALAGRARAWLVLSDVRHEGPARRSVLRGWREVDRVYAKGVQAVLLERAADGARHASRAGGE